MITCLQVFATACSLLTPTALQTCICQVASCGVTAEFVVCAVNAISVKRRFAAGSAQKQVISEHLFIAQAQIFVECEFVRLKEIFAAKIPDEKVSCKLDQASF